MLTDYEHEVAITLVKALCEYGLIVESTRLVMDSKKLLEDISGNILKIEG